MSALGPIIVIIIIIGILSFLVDSIGCLPISVAVIAFVVSSFMGFDVFLSIGISLAFIAASFILASISRGIGDAVERHDAAKVKAAELKQYEALQRSQTALIERQNKNELLLRRTLEESWKNAGYTTSDFWKSNLPNFRNKEYPSNTSFETITRNFAVQSEAQMLSTQDWLVPYTQAIAHAQIITLAQLLATVNCPSLLMTHVTPDAVLVERGLDSLTKRQSVDVPALLKKLSWRKVFFMS